MEASIRRRQRLLWVAIVLIALGELLAWAGSGSGAHRQLGSLGPTLAATALIYAFNAPKRWLALGIGVGLEAVASWRGMYGTGLGVAAIGVAAVDWLRGRDREALLRLLDAILWPVLVLGAWWPTELAMFMHPVAYDGAAWSLDVRLLGAGLGSMSNPMLPRIAAGVPIYLGLIVALARRARLRDDLHAAYGVALLLLPLLWQITPMVSPANHPNGSGIVPTSLDLNGDLRNATPAFGVVVLVLAFWTARGLGRLTRAVVAVLALVVAFSAAISAQIWVATSIGLAVPTAAFIRALGAPRSTARIVTLAASAALFFAWAIYFRLMPKGFPEDAPTRFAFAFTVGVPFWLEARVARAERDEIAAIVSLPPPPATAKPARLVAAIFVASGFAGLLYEVVFAKALAHVFGSTAVATTTVLVTYMGGMALGSYAGGRLRPKVPLRAYAFCELGVAIACALSPVMAGVAKGAFLAIARGTDPGQPGMVAVQIGLGALVLLVPTLLMGMTLPILGRDLERAEKTVGTSIALLYGANTFGAACGAVVTSYLLLPRLGLFGATLVGVAANLSVALVALRLSRRATAASAETADAIPRERAPARLGHIGLAVLAGGGLVSLALEVTYTHLLAVVVGTSVYAFASMLFAFLIGLSLGAAAGRAWLRRAYSTATGMGVAQAGLAIVVLGAVFAWNAVPGYFADFHHFQVARTFATSELIRFLVAAGLLVPPAVFIGASYPLAIDAVTRAATDPIRGVGVGTASNTLGNIIGALAASFVLVPLIGSLRTLHVLALVALALAVATVSVGAGRRPIFLAVAAALGLLFVQPASFDLTRLSRGANVYFASQPYGFVIDSAESVDGGLTTVAVRKNERGELVKTLLTNGKFQGDDDPLGEMRAQYGFVMLPLLHTAQRGNALVIGLGTGATTRAAADAGFEHVTTVELSRDIATMAKKHFVRAHANVFERPNVDLAVTDGRTYLALHDTKYDLLVIELSSIWFAGAATLYNREFYETAKAHIAPGGVFEQWVQLHHIDQVDLASIFATIRAVFPKTVLYTAHGQGIVVSCNGDECLPSPEAIAKLESTPTLEPEIEIMGVPPSSLVVFRELGTKAMDRLLAATPGIISTDDNSFLEYHTPRGNVAASESSMDGNLEFLRQFKLQPTPP